MHGASTFNIAVMCGFLAVAMLCAPARAQDAAAIPPPPPPAESNARSAALMDLARHFVTRISKGFDAADAAMGLPADGRQAEAILPEGEMLLFNVNLPRGLMLEDVVGGEMRNRKILLSLSDFIAALEFQIEVDADAGRASGWYGRETRVFDLDLDARRVSTEQGTFTPSALVVSENGDILVPVDELATWFGFEMNTRTASLQLFLTSPIPLPVQERLARGERKNLARSAASRPVLPLHEDAPGDIAPPFIDVMTTQRYHKNGGTGKGNFNASASVATKGDLAKGTLSTRTQLDDRNGVSGVRANFKRESPEPDLLGPLKAQKYELGDLTPPRLALSERSRAGTGARISSIDPTRSYFNPSAGISGSAQPGWDVELYRGGQLLDTQNVGPDGQYNFDNVDLFRSRNNFRLVFYGPQGQQREEVVVIPVDPRRLADTGGVYDIAVTADGTQLYRRDGGPANEGDPRLTALYEHAVGSNSAVQLGLESERRDGDALSTAHAGFSTVLGDALINTAGAVDQHGEAGAELVWRQDFGAHQLRNRLSWASDGFAVSKGVTNRETLEQDFVMNGPVALPLGRNSRYSAGLNYRRFADESDIKAGTLGLSTTMGRVWLNQRLEYSRSSFEDDDRLRSLSTLRGTIANTRLRFDADYDIRPDAHLESIGLNAQRYITENVDMQIDATHRPEDKLNTIAAQANIRTGKAIVSPSLSYNSDGDVVAMLNTSLGIAPDPKDGGYRMTENMIAANGALAAYVFLDKNGNNRPDEGEEAIADARVMLLQNGGVLTTDADGYAYSNRLQNFRQTDVYVMPESLADPYWVPSGAGVSILPREGHLTRLNFPVHVAGEVDGTVYAIDDSGQTMPMRGVSLGLYKASGEKLMSTQSEQDGFYVFSPVPPGEYAIVVDGASIRRDNLTRPEPMPITIGYDGATLYGRHIYLRPGADAPIRMVADAAAIAGEDPAMNVSALDGKAVVMNLGAYKSRVLMGVMWYKIRQSHAAIADGLAPLVEPSESYAATKTGQHTLRIGGPGLQLEDARTRCATLNAAGFKCAVEVLPGGLKIAAK